MTHSKEKPYQCRYCEETFSHTHIRTRHEDQTHYIVKPPGSPQATNVVIAAKLFYIRLTGVDMK